MGKIIFFGGKGGVGKTSCSGAFAYQRAKEGNKVLLVSTDPAHSVSDLFECEIGSDIVQLGDNLFATEIDAEKESEKYIEGVRTNVNKIYSAVVVQEINKQLDAAKVSPGTHEAALFDKMIELINTTSASYDYIIFDTAPTGHTVRLLTLPDLLESWIDSLLNKRRQTVKYKEMADKKPVGSSSDEVIGLLLKRKRNLVQAKRILLDSGKLGFVFVLNAEKLAIDETIKATSILKKFKVPIAAYVVNRILPDNPTDDFWKEKKAIEKEHLDAIDKHFSDATIYKIPLLVHDMNRNEVELIAKSFE